ncbi:hypothetical protein DFJ73DRAFT_875419 [Zopfochytrium polystomum]|nr:hypothetical protein DFJ73DRAFT_875419 [Zopfochytrium polystomum]
MPPADTLFEVAPGFYVIQTVFKKFSLIDIGTHMSFIRLSSGKFLVIDTVELTPAAKAAVDKLTNNGDLIEAVIGSHPYHTLYFKSFLEKYPDKECWGTKRHLRVCDGIKWAGDITTVLTKWNPDVHLRVPVGTDFDDPTPDNNHFAGLFVFHPSSKTLHVDDTLMLGGADSPFLFRSAVGVRLGEVGFHPTLTGPGIRDEPGAPEQFRCFIEGVCDDWEFENLVAAHKGVLQGGARGKVREALARATPTLMKMGVSRVGVKGEELEAYKKQWIPGKPHECG